MSATELAETLGMLVEALNAWEGYEQEAHDAGRCIGYGFCMTEPCTEMSPRIDEIRRSIGIQASAAATSATLSAQRRGAGGGAR